MSQGRLLNYAELPNAFIDDVVPNHYRVPIASAVAQRMREVSKQYSKVS